MSKHVVSKLVAVLAVTLPGTQASAGIYGDDLGKCLVASTSAKDQTDLVRWLFSAAALHPDVASISAVAPAERTAMTEAVAELFQRLLTDSCRKEFAAAIQYEGAAVLESSFSVLGQVAMRSLMSHADVAKGLGELDAYIDKAALESASKLPEPSP
jgi:hypothetical protein